ncbi:MAG: hypothetical protein EPO57_03375 [Chitinophagaceae bacterium]|nr:MAG: hypothetical protein EPO57_03375 [Chitinophagaceae bacterium]
MNLIEVTTSSLAKDFISVNVELNKDNSNYIRPLDKDVRAVFDNKKNKSFQSGKLIRWIVTTETGELIGRIAAFVQPKYKNKGDEFAVGGIGFFDCINNQATANLLFDAAKKWLLQQKVQAMDGPINFGERDRWWGLLIDGFEPPLYGMNYNPTYYQNLFETYGFQVFYNQICWKIGLPKKSGQLAPRLYQAHKKFALNPDYKTAAIDKNKLEKFASDFTSIYNKAWAIHEGNKEMKTEDALKLFTTMKPVMDENAIFFAYHKNEPIALFISLPDLNQIFKFLDGKFNWWAKLKFLFLKKTKSCTRLVGIIYGLIPEFQGSGVDYFMLAEAEKVLIEKTKYESFEMQWQGDFNPKMLNISKNLGAKQNRRLVTYRYLFDRTKEFKRHPLIN